ncbi:MAG: hypothetical protein ACYC5O_13440 [Anaerolineae bacterium]
MRLGTGPRLLSRPDLRTYDTRLPFEARQLSVGLACLHDLLVAARQLDVRFYRMAAALVPVMAAADLPRFLRQLDECLALAEWVGAEAKAAGMRLTVHPVLDVQFGSSEDAIVDRSVALVRAWHALFAAMGLGGEACVVVHRCGAGRSAESVFAAHVLSLPEAVRARLALENDERQCSLSAALRLGGKTGLPVVWDYLHWRCGDGDGRSPGEAYAAAAATWPPGVPPKVHYSSPRTTAQRGRPPQPREHADYLDPFAFADFSAQVGPQCDVMLEARAKDLALLKLRQDLEPSWRRCGRRFDGGALAAAG